MKKILTTFLTLLCFVIPCFTFAGCGSKFAGTQYVLTEISASYDETIEPVVKADYEKLIQQTNEKIGSEEAPYIKFYSINNVFVTNCTGKIQLGFYRSNGGKLAIDQPTFYDHTKYKNKIETKFLLSSDMENAVFANEKENISLTVTADGATVKYGFTPNGKLNESPTDYANSRYELADVPYWSYPDNEEETSSSRKSAISSLNLYCNVITFSGSKCKFAGLTFSYDCKQSDSKDEHLIRVGNAEHDDWSTMTLYAYGDLLVSTSFYWIKTTE